MIPIIFQAAGTENPVWVSTVASLVGSLMTAVLVIVLYFISKRF